MVCLTSRVVEMPKREKRFWTENDEVILYAWLDFCKGRGYDFFKTVESHLAERASDPFTITQVRNKLCGELRRYGKLNNSALILRDGSSYFPGVTKEGANKIRMELDRYTKEFPSGFNLPYAAADSRQTTSKRKEVLPPRPSKRPRLDSPENISKAASSSQPRVQTTSPSSIRVGSGDVAPNLGPIQQDLSKEVEALKEDNNQLQKQFLRQSLKYSRREAEMRKQMKDLQVLVNSRAPISLGSGEGKESAEAIIVRLMNQVSAKDQKIRSQHTQLRFTSLTPNTSSVEEIYDHMKKTMTSLEIGIDDLLLDGQWRMETLSDFQLVCYSDLLQSICENPDNELDAGRCLQDWNETFGSEILTKVLILCAIRDWVFYSEFPGRADPNDWLLTAYRDILMVRGDSQYLHSLDLAAYDHYISSETFEDVVLPRESQRLASQFLDMYSSLFAVPRNEKEAGSAKEWHDIRGSKKRLASVFKVALELKAATVTVDLDYEFTVYPPGTASEPHKNHTVDLDYEFTVYSPGTASESHKNHMDFACISLYDRQLDQSSKRMSDSLVRPRNFIIASTSNPVRTPKHRRFMSAVSPYNDSPSPVDRLDPTFLIPQPSNAITDLEVEEEEERDDHNIEDNSSEDGSMDQSFSRPGYPARKNNNSTSRVKCDRCDADFANIGNMKRHKQKKHLDVSAVDEAGKIVLDNARPIPRENTEPLDRHRRNTHQPGHGVAAAAPVMLDASSNTHLSQSYEEDIAGASDYPVWTAPEPESLMPHASPVPDVLGQFLHNDV